MNKIKPRRYAEGTTVDVSKSQEEIKRLLERHGANGFLLAEARRDDGQLVGMLQFRIYDRMLKYERTYPTEKEVPRAPTNLRYDLREPWRKGWRDAEWRRRWRALALIIKAKLEMVASGDTTFDREFLADIMLPNGTTVGTTAIPAIAEAYSTGTMPRLLPGNVPA